MLWIQQVARSGPRDVVTFLEGAVWGSSEGLGLLAPAPQCAVVGHAFLQAVIINWCTNDYCTNGM